MEAGGKRIQTGGVLVTKRDERGRETKRGSRTGR